MVDNATSKLTGSKQGELKIQVTLYVKHICMIYYKNSFNALIMLCNAPYYAL